MDLTVGDTDFGNDDTISSVSFVEVDGNPGRISLLPFDLKFLRGLSICNSSLSLGGELRLEESDSSAILVLWLQHLSTLYSIDFIK